MTGRQRRNLTEIKKIARFVRAAFEKIAKKDRYSTNLMGMCYRASAQIFLECRHKGIRVQIAKAPGHVFCTYAGHIIDVTATQFPSKPAHSAVVVKPIPKYPPRYHQVCSKYDSVKKSGYGSKYDRAIVVSRRR